MKSSRFSLQASERRKLVTISNREIDSMARARVVRHEEEAARQDASRQALRDALRRHYISHGKGWPLRPRGARTPRPGRTTTALH